MDRVWNLDLGAGGPIPIPSDATINILRDRREYLPDYIISMEPETGDILIRPDVLGGPTVTIKTDIDGRIRISRGI